MTGVKRFELGETITEEQRAHLDEHGYLIFESVASPEEVDLIRKEIDRIEADWIEAKRRSVFGIPIFEAVSDRGAPFIQRLPFTSCFSDPIKSFVRNRRLDPVRSLIGQDTRVGDAEKDGVVVNQFLNVPGSVHREVGWHTDGLRDLFYLRMPKPQLNVGLHLDDCTAENGGLRLIPGTHKQGFLSMCFKKAYFINNKEDPNEVMVETKAGDLTVHDGRLWHRVARSTREGPTSLRRTMYVPYLTDHAQPKTERSPTPLYHRLARWIRESRNRSRRRLLTAGSAQ